MLAKNRSLVTAIAILLIIALGGYYLLRLKQPPYPVSSFVAVRYQWGIGDTLANSYSSKTGHYQYLDNRDQLQVRKVRLQANDIIFIHNKANEAGLWDLPTTIGTPGKDVLRYEMGFEYKEKTKKIVYYTNSDDANLSQKASALQQLLAQVIDEAEQRGH